MQLTALEALVAALAIGTTQAAPTVPELITTPTHIERYRKIVADASGEKPLPEPELSKATIWDFGQGRINATGTNGGAFSTASQATLPFLFDTGITITYGDVGPCGIVLPHVHPRANEFFLVIDNDVIVGTRLEAGTFGKNGNTEYVHKLPAGSGTLFPQGAVHWQINDNPGCKSTRALVFLTSDDPGTTPVLQEPVAASMAKRSVGRAEFEEIRPIVPPHIVKLVDQCFQRCNIA